MAAGVLLLFACFSVGVIDARLAQFFQWKNLREFLLHHVVISLFVLSAALNVHLLMLDGFIYLDCSLTIHSNFLDLLIDLFSEAERVLLVVTSLCRVRGVGVVRV